MISVCKKAAWMVAALLLASPAGAQVSGPGIPTFDFGNALLQYGNFLTQIANLKNQLQQQENMVASLGTDVTGPIVQAFTATNGLVNTIGNISQQGAQLQAAVTGLFPQGFQNSSPQQIMTAVGMMDTYLRSNQQAAYAIQNQVATNQAVVQQQVAAGVIASNGAVGQTAALQATNQILASISTQLSDMQSLLVTMSRSMTDTAEAQAAAAQAATQDTGSETSNYTPTWSYSGVTGY